MLPKRQQVLLFLARIWLGGLFAFSGWSKAVEPYENFRGVLSQYALIPSAVAPLIARSFPWVELITGVFLITGYALRASALGAAALSGVFVLLIGISQVFGFALPAECGCFGAGLHFTPSQMLGIDALSVILALLIFSRKDSFLGLDQVLKK